MFPYGKPQQTAEIDESCNIFVAVKLKYSLHLSFLYSDILSLLRIGIYQLR